MLFYPENLNISHFLLFNELATSVHIITQYAPQNWARESITWEPNFPYPNYGDVLLLMNHLTLHFLAFSMLFGYSNALSQSSHKLTYSTSMINSVISTRAQSTAKRIGGKVRPKTLLYLTQFSLTLLYLFYVYYISSFSNASPSFSVLNYRSKIN